MRWLRRIGAAWPMVWKGTYEKSQAENRFLRDALHNANTELRKHRMLIASMREADPKVTDFVMKVGR